MLKLFFSLILAVLVANASSTMMQEGEVAVTFKGYRVPSNTPIKGAFEKVNFRQTQAQAQTLGEVFVNSYIDIESKSAVIKSEEKDNELLKFVFNSMNIHNIKTKITEIKANRDAKTKVRTGKFFVNISMNGVLKNIPMNYTFKNGEVVINGVIDVTEFNAGFILELVNQEFDRQKQERVSKNVEIQLSTKVKSADRFTLL